MTFTFELKTVDGDDAGTLRTSEVNWQPGDTVIAEGNRRYRVTAVIPRATIGEFVDGANSGLLEVEPLWPPTREGDSDASSWQCVTGPPIYQAQETGQMREAAASSGFVLEIHELREDGLPLCGPKPETWRN